MPLEGTSVSFDIANGSSSTKIFYWYLRQSSGDIRWTDFDDIGTYSDVESVVSGTKSVAGGLTEQVTLNLALDTLVEEEEAFDVVVSDSQLSLSQIQAATSTASFTIQDATIATISKQSSSEYSTASTSIKDYEIPGGGSFSSTDFNWRSVNTSDLFYVSSEALVLEDDADGAGQGAPKFELALKDSNGTFRREFTSQEINPNGITYDTLRVREATADTDGNIYVIINADQDAFTSVFQEKDYLIKINGAGNVVFTKDISETTSIRDFQALQIDGNGGIIVASYADDYADSPPSTLPRIDRYDAETGNILWSQRPALGMDTGSVRISERPIQILNDGSLLFAVSGYIGVEDPTFGTYIIRMDLSTGTPSQMLGIDGDNSYFQNEFVVDSGQLFYRTKLGVYEITTGSNPKVLTYPSSSYVPPSTGGGGGTSTSNITPTPTTGEDGIKNYTNTNDLLADQSNVKIRMMDGNDYLEITGGINNFANGNIGDDRFVLRSGEASQYLGGKGSDTFEVFGGIGNDVNGNKGDDIISLNGGQGRYRGGDNNDRIDVFNAEAGSFVNGNSGEDIIIGNTGGVVYRGGKDNDTLAISQGETWGDKGADTFRGVTGEGYSAIQDYTIGEDVVELAMDGAWSKVESGLMFTDNSGDQIMLLLGINNIEQVIAT